jgi:MFS family permease
VSNSPQVRRILLAKGVRAFGDGFVSVLLPLYLLELGLGPLQVGIIATATLLGSGVLTLAVGLRAHRFAFRTLLLAASALMAATGLGFAFVTAFWPLLVIAIIGTLNPSSGDVSVFLPLEHAMLSRLIGDKERTSVFARYSLVGSLAAAVGSLAAAAPSMIGAVAGWSIVASIQTMFVVYAALGVLAAIAYGGLPPTAESAGRRTAVPLREAKKRVWTLAALFSMDAFGGGFVVQSMVALWLYQRFGMSLGAAGAIFFWTGILTAGSYLVAVRIAGRFGLINTMVFTHIPSSVCLILIPFMPDLGWAIALLFLRAALSQMDHLGASEPRVRREPVSRRLAAHPVVVRLAAPCCRRHQDRLRRAAVRAVPQREAAGGGEDDRRLKTHDGRGVWAQLSPRIREGWKTSSVGNCASARRQSHR